MFDKLIHTSPPTKHPRVKDAQWLLAGNNRHGQRTYSGKFDGIYGEGTAHAADRMRYWLGYPVSKIDGSPFGAQLYGYLVKKGNPQYRPLPAAYRLRRKARLLKEKRRIAAALKPKGKRAALARLLGEVGEHEVGHSNWNKYGQWYGWNGVPWCAQFLSWGYAPFGFKFKTALARQFMYWGRAGTYGLRITYHPEPGDIVVFDMGGGHVGTFIQGNASRFESIEGNTSCSGGSWDNGGEVCRKWHGRERNPVFVRVP